MDTKKEVEFLSDLINHKAFVTPEGRLLVIADTEIIHVKSIGECGVSQVLSCMKTIATEFNLNLSTNRGWRIAKQILVESVKSN